ncbi:adenylyltransferase/cytidyltransferase family protein [Amnibacterium kyonggiense]|uniref:Cytidyltransferase-like protein n=1 Tax=Amnibacterium kyonggiense TaxID=595671 RepID=A0A4V3EAT6_9MICO|nr:adenylyltransferase/cytidyltransferase family protein [Amnibacterium kyonggiense]TDS77254.1 cytidyltransferase-like protein [Amnibacterium kyonggiense]
MSKPFRHGLALGKFYPLHAGYSNLIRKALRQCDEVTVQLLVNSAETNPLKTRLTWLQQEHPNANIVAGVDDSEVDFDSPTAWDEHMRAIERLLPKPIDAAFTSNECSAELVRRLGALWVQVDPG